MKYPPEVTPRGGLRFVAVLLMCFAALVHIGAMDETPKGLRRGEVQNSERVSADGAEAVGKQSLLYRERRAVKNSAELVKRLQAMEERYALSWFHNFVISKELKLIRMQNVLIFF